MTAGLVAWMLRLPEFAPWRGRALTLWGPGGWAAGAEMRRIGLAGGAAYFFETFAFAAHGAGGGAARRHRRSPPTPSCTTSRRTVFMVALGLSVGDRGAGRPGRRGRRPRRARASPGSPASPPPWRWSALIGLAMLAAAPTVVGFYSSDPALIARAAPLDRDPRRLHGVRRRPGGARPGDPRARRFLGHHRAASSSPSGG